MNNKFTIEAILKASGADQFSKDFQNATKSMDGIERASKKSAGGLKSFIGGVGKIAGAIGVTKLVSAGFNAIRSSVDGAVSRVDTLNQFPKVLQQMGASGEDADRSIARLSDGIQGLPTTLDGVASTAQRMFTILGDIDLATESTLALNNAFLASGASQADASRGLEQYTQMLSAGKVDMQSWRTLQETMPYALKETAEAFGFTGQSATNDFYAALQSGEITMDEMNEKIIELSNETGGFAETALEASKGLATSWQNIKTAIVTGVANVIQAINEWMEDAGLGGIADNFDKVKVAVQGAFSYIVENIPTVLNGIMGLFDTVKNSTAFQTLKEVIGDVIEIGKELIQQFLQSEAWANFKSLMGEIAQAILDINFGQLVADVSEFLEKWSPLIAGIIAGVIAFKGLTFVAGMFSAISAAGGILAIVMGTLSAAGAVLGGVIAFLTSPITLTAIAIGALIAAGVLLWQNWDTIREKAIAIWSAITSYLSSVWQSVKNQASAIWSSISQMISNKWNAVQSLTVSVWNSIRSMLSGVWNGIRSQATSIFNSIRSLVTSIWNAIRSITSSVWNGIRSLITSILNGIRSTFTSIFNSLRGIVSSAFSAVRSAVMRGMQSALSAVTSFFGRFRSAGSNIVGNIANGIRGAIGKVTSAMRGVLSAARNLLPFSPPKDKSSPLVDIHKNGIVEQIAKGITNNAGDLERAASSALNGVQSALNAQSLDASLGLDSALARAHTQVNGNIRHEVGKLDVAQRPAYINLSIGGQQFTAFVENISNEQGRLTDLDMQF